MSRPMTLFTGQWADLPLDEVAEKAAAWGYDGLELACWGDHFEVDKALAEDDYCERKRAQLAKYGLGCWIISSHLVGQAVCDHPIDERHKNVLPARIRGDGDPEGVRRRAAAEMQDTARAAARFGITLAGFPPVPAAMIDDGYRDFADRWNPIIDVFDANGVRFALEVHPSEIAYDYWTTRRTLDAIGNRPGFGLHFDPSHFMWQDLDPVAFLRDYASRIYHVDCEESVRHLDGRTAGSARIFRSVIYAAAGISYRSVTAMCRGSTSSGCSMRSATRVPFRSNGRMPAWIANSAHPKRSHTCANSHSNRRGVPSMRLLLRNGNR